MKSQKKRKKTMYETVPKLLPAGSVNRVLLIGGRNLTTFQAIGLMFIGVCVAGGVGGLILIGEFGLGSGSGGHGDALYLLLGAFAMVLWGLVMFVNGLRGILRRFRTKRIAE
jgi:hypothetical protein